eukprot:4041987-Amphidinium_carterae.1
MTQAHPSLGGQRRSRPTPLGRVRGQPEPRQCCLAPRTRNGIAKYTTTPALPQPAESVQAL